MTFEIDLSWDDLVEPAPKPVKEGGRPGIQCLCGRFSKWVGDQHYYNGTFDCYRYTVLCSRCGYVDIECV